MDLCNVCFAANLKELYRSRSMRSITTMNKAVAGETCVYVCSACSHVQTKPLFDLNEYYHDYYEINLSSLQHDQLYSIDNGKKIFRNEHQGRVLLEKLKLKNEARILDYGCGNGLTLQHLLRFRGNLNCFAFDVTDKYEFMWEQFLPRPNFAFHELPVSWEHGMDVVTSFFALEHVEHPRSFVSNLSKYLCEEGILYIVVPNMYQNFADMLVADHVNHFSETSLYILLENYGFRDINIDSTSHNAALIAVAKGLSPKLTDATDLDKASCCGSYLSKAQEISAFWSSAIEKMKIHLDTHKGFENIIYGAGVYGSWIHQYLSQWDNVRCFVDKNAYVHGTHASGLQINSPDEIDIKGKNIWFGLNPNIAEDVAQSYIKNTRVHSHFYFEI